MQYKGGLNAASLPSPGPLHGMRESGTPLPAPLQATRFSHPCPGPAQGGAPRLPSMAPLAGHALPPAGGIWVRSGLKVLGNI